MSAGTDTISTENSQLKVHTMLLLAEDYYILKSNLVKSFKK